MLITALTKLTLLDFPGKLACIIFTGGCNLRCGYCHNGEFVLPEKLAALGKGIPFETVTNFLKARKGKLDGVVICGGEPTVQPDLLKRMAELKALGMAVKLDTNGYNPDLLEKAIKEGLVDYIAMDLKDALPYRKEVVGVSLDAEKIRRSIKLIITSGLAYEFRSTILPQKHDLETLEKMGREIAGARLWVLQRFRAFKTLDPAFAGLDEYSSDQLKALPVELAAFAEKVEIRF